MLAESMFLLGLPGGSEWIIIILVVLLLFGGRKIPELMRGLGQGIREFQDAKSNVKKEIEKGMDKKQEPEKPAEIPKEKGSDNSKQA